MKILAQTVATLMLLLASGCSNPGVVQISPDTYMLSRVDRAGVFGNAAALKAGVIRDANAFAESKGKVAIPITSKESPIERPGQFASFEYQFRVVPKDDPEAKRTALMPRADLVVEKTEKISAEIRTQQESTQDLYAELTKLDDLRKRGILTEEEFSAQKKRLLEKQ